MNKYRRNKEITRQVHRLFWQANFVDKFDLLVAYFTRSISYVALNTLIPLFSALGIQSIINRDIGGVRKDALIVFILGLIYGVFSGIGNYTVSKNAIAGSKFIQNLVLKNYLSKDYEFFSNAYYGALGAKAAGLRDAYNEYGELVTQSIPRQALIVIASLVAIATQSLLLAIATLVALSFVLGFTILAGAYRFRFRRLVSEASSAVAGSVGDSLSHAHAVKSFASEENELKRLSVPLNNWAYAQFRSWISNIVPDAVRMLLASLTTGILLVISANLYIDKKISLTIVILIQLYVVRLIAATLDIAEIVKRYEQIMGRCYDAVATLLVETQVNDALEPKIIPNNHRLELVLDEVCFSYPESKAKEAIKDFTFSVKPGEKIGLVGYSGSGKTTLTKLLLRFMDVSSGSISLAGIDIRQLKQADLRGYISYVPQEPLLFHRTVKENIAYSKTNATNAEVMKAAKLAYVDEFAKGLPAGYDTLVGERGVKLSGGQRQRVAIARAILKNSPILVLDEATSALDSESEKYIQDALWELMKDKTAIVIAHRLSTIQRLDKIIVMDKGKIVQVGSHADLLGQAEGIYARLWQHQSGGYLQTKPTDA